MSTCKGKRVGLTERGPSCSVLEGMHFHSSLLTTHAQESIQSQALGHFRLSSHSKIEILLASWLDPDVKGLWLNMEKLAYQGVEKT